MLPKSSKPGPEIQPETGIALATQAKPCLCSLCPGPAHLWGVCTPPHTAMLLGLISAGQKGEGVQVTPGEPALCKGMAVMAGERMWCGLCWTLPPPHHTPRVSKVQTGPLALCLLHLTAQPGASNEAQTRSEHVSRTVEMVKDGLRCLSHCKSRKEEEQGLHLYLCISRNGQLSWVRLYWCVHEFICIMLASVFLHL